MKNKFLKIVVLSVFIIIPFLFSGHLAYALMSQCNPNGTPNPPDRVCSDPDGGSSGGTPSNTCFISSFTANPVNPAYGTSATLDFFITSDYDIWDIIGGVTPNSGVISGGGAGGQVITGNLTVPQTYRLTCGSATQDLTVTPQLTGSCSASPNPQNINQNVTWTAVPSGGNGTYTYSWSGDVSGPGNSVVNSYSTSGTKTGRVTIASGIQTFTTPDCSVLIPQASGTYNLTVSKNGTGSGSVSGVSNPVQANIDCGPICVQTYTSGTNVTLTATPSSGSSITNWSGGGCSGAGPSCTINNLRADTSVAVTFTATTALPDLTASAPSPSTAVIGVPQTFSSVISNIGDASTGASFYNSLQVALGAGGSGAVSPLIPSSPSPIPTLYSGDFASTQAAYIFLSTGLHSVRFCADNNTSMAGTINESDEDNNCSPWVNVNVTTQVPVVTISANPTSMTLPENSTTLSWSATNNPTGCTASGSWSGSKPVAGPQTISSLTAGTYTYTLVCTNSSGQSAPASATVTVSAVPIVMSGTLSELSSCEILSGDSSCNATLSWGIVNPATTPTAITASGMTNINVSNSTTPSTQSGTRSVPVPAPSAQYLSRTFYLYNNGISLVPAGVTVIPSCESGTIWSGGVCTPTSNPIDGVCSSAHYNCSSGTSSGTTGDTSTNWNWRCDGSNGGASPSCTEAKIMTGEITPASSSCIIIAGDNKCTKLLSWTTDNPVATSAVTSPTGTPSPVNGNNGSQTFNVPYNASGVNFYLNNNAVQLDQAVVSTICEPDTTWNVSTSTCTGTNVLVINISANPTTMTLPANSTTLSWNATNSAFGCTASDGSSNTTWNGERETSGLETVSNLPAGSHEFTLTCNSAIGAAPISATTTVTVNSASLPDLTASVISPTTATAGVAQTYSATISNIGSVSTGASFQNKFQTSPVPDGSSGVVEYTVSPNMSALGASGSSSTSRSITLSAGTYYMRACADLPPSPNGIIAESNEGNNCSPSWTAVVVSAPPLPDLTVLDPVVPITTPINTPTSFSATVKNIGTASTGTSFPVTLRRSPGAGGQSIPWVTLVPQTKGPLGAGVSDNSYISQPFSFPSAGTWSVQICADLPPPNPYGAIVESDENNNCSSWTNVTVTNGPFVPIVTTKTSCTNITQNSATSGGTTVSNEGATVTVAGITWSTSANPTYAGGGPISGPTGQTTDGWLTGGPWTSGLTGLTAGTLYHIRAYAKNSVGTAYGSDVTCTTSTVSMPNLTASAPTQTFATINIEKTFTSTITNIGNSSTVGTFLNSLQISTSAGGGNPTFPLIVGTPNPMSALGSGFSSTASAPYTFTTEGTYSVRFCADNNASMAGTINEGTNGGENDNCSAWINVDVTDIIPGPDVVAGLASPSSPPQVGVDVTFSATITNIGTIRTGPPITAFPNFFQISATPNGGGGYTDLAPSSMNALNPAASSPSASPSYKFTDEGEYSVRACADKSDRNTDTTTDSVNESNENNNCGDWTNLIVGAKCSQFQGNSCTSSANSCGMTNSGTIDCNGNCSASTPPDSACDGGGCVNGATNPPECTIDGGGCINGATNPPLCTIDGGGGCLNGAVNPPACTIDGGGACLNGSNNPPNCQPKKPIFIED